MSHAAGSNGLIYLRGCVTGQLLTTLEASRMFQRIPENAKALDRGIYERGRYLSKNRFIVLHCFYCYNIREPRVHQKTPLGGKSYRAPDDTKYTILTRAQHSHR
jgi:hypothetical protein